jgi:hypothetical protein
MKIYIGKADLESQGFKCITEPRILEYLVDDSEATEIVFDNVLRSSHLKDIDSLMDLAVKKLRISGCITIVDIDFELLQFAYEKQGNIVELNNLVIGNNIAIRSFLTNELILDIAKSKNLIIEFNNTKNIEFLVKLRRNSNAI